MKRMIMMLKHANTERIHSNHSLGYSSLSHTLSFYLTQDQQPTHSKPADQKEGGSQRLQPDFGTPANIRTVYRYVIPQTGCDLIVFMCVVDRRIERKKEKIILSRFVGAPPKNQYQLGAERRVLYRLNCSRLYRTRRSVAHSNKHKEISLCFWGSCLCKLFLYPRSN